jgi:hypothetical protein
VFALPGADDGATIVKYKRDRRLAYFCSDVIEAVLDKTEDLEPTQGFEDPLEFERWCAEQLKSQGWDARTTKGSGDQGADVIAERDGLRVVLQCKLYGKAVGNKAVQEAYAAMQFEGAHLACVVTNAAYTTSARTLAKRTGVILLHQDDLIDFDAVCKERDEFLKPRAGLDGADEDQSAEDVPGIFAQHGDRALEIVSSRPQFWEYLLVEELLRSKLITLKEEDQDLERVYARKRRRHYDASRYLGFQTK